jgi:hypothetical protein
MGRQYRVLDQVMMSLGDKEATYDAGPAAWTAGAAIQPYEFGEGFAAWDDKIVSDRETVHGSQFATVDEIARQDVGLVLSMPRVRPALLGGLIALGGGVLAVVQDGALAAYRHKATPVAADVELPSIGAIEKSGGEQYKYTGMKLDRFSIKRGGPDNAYFEVEAALVGSGTRASDATAFVAKITESPLLWGNAKCWLETGANISIDAAPTQGLENISSATPDVLTTRLVDFEFFHENDLQADDGYQPGSGKVRGRLDHGPNRRAHIRVVVEEDPATLATERGYYDNRDNVAIELDVDSGVIIAATGAYKYGFDLIIPRMRLDQIKRDVRAKVEVLTFEGDCFDEGTNPLWQFYTYNSYVAYLV